MDPKITQQYRAELTLPHSTISITSTDVEQIKNQVREICKAENIKPVFDNHSSYKTLFVSDDTGQPLGQIASYEVNVWMSVNQTFNARKQAERAA